MIRKTDLQFGVALDHGPPGHDVFSRADEAAVLDRVNEHLSAGADHVCVQVLTANPNDYPREQWQRIAAALR